MQRRPPTRAESSDHRWWRSERWKVQPYWHYESSDVVVAPSKVHGLGVFAARDFKKGETVGWYGGLCVKCGITSSRFVIEVDSFNHNTSTLEIWHLDAKDWKNACARWINDSIGTEWAGVYNVRWIPRCSKDPHPVYGTYTAEIVATCDIRKDEELFMSYGAAYWSRFKNYKTLDPDIPTGTQYKQCMRRNCRR